MKKIKSISSPSMKADQRQNLPEVQAQKNSPADLWSVAAIILLGTLIYSNSFDCSFHLDDAINIVDNAAIRNLFDVKTWWNYNPSRPIPFFSFALNYHFSQYNVWGWHLFNLVVHLINAVLVWWLSTLVFSSPALKEHPLSKHKSMLALLTALLFVSHPLATQSVTYIVQRMASMVALFYMLSVALYMAARLRENNSVAKYLLFAGSFGSAVLALLTKENAFTLPFAILLVEVCFLSTKNITINFKNKNVLLMLAAGLGVILFALTKYSVGTFFKPLAPASVNDFQTVTSLNYLFSQFSVLVKYIGLLLLPIHQNLDYDFKISNSFFELKTLLNFGVLFALFTLGVLAFKKYRILSFGIFWFFLTLSIESSIIPISDLIFEHRTYLPSLGFFLILSSGTYALLYEKNKTLAMAALVLIIGTNSILTFQRNKVWKDDLTLWSDVVSKSPNKARGYYSLGSIFDITGDKEQALKNLNKALELQPAYAEAYNNRGLFYKRNGNYDEAIKDLNKAIAFRPQFSEALANLGSVYIKQGKYDQAINDCNTAIKQQPNFAGAYFNRAVAYANLGQTKNALADFSRAVELNVGYAEAYTKRGIEYMKENKTSDALNDLNQAIKLDPKYPEAFINRGIFYINEGKNDDALKDLNRAIELKPGYSEAFNNRGLVFYNQKKYEQALAEYNKALELNPKYTDAFYNRGLIYFDLGETDKAITEYSNAIESDPSFIKAYVNRGNAFTRIQKNSEALNDFNKAVQLNPGFASTYNSIGILLYNQKRYQEAIKNYAKAIELKSDYAKAYYNRGIARYYLGEKNAACQDLNKAASLGYEAAKDASYKMCN
jgi:tetratricopeptide (TPR) repeat protein